MVSAIDFLLASQNPDGGWGYKLGGMSFVEPTACAVLALLAESKTPQPVARALELLERTQLGDGGWGVAALDQESGWMTAWAALALLKGGRAGAPSGRGGLEWLRKTQGLTVTAPLDRAHIRELFQIDSALVGWPWLPGDASWVFPTALSMLALSAAGRTSDPRLEQGASFLLDRAVPSGGWNIGNGFQLGRALPATIQATAVAMLALRMITPQSSQFKRAGAFLSEGLEQAPAAGDLAWGLLAVSQVPAATARLRDLEESDGSWEHNPYHTALAAIASRTAAESPF